MTRRERFATRSGQPSRSDTQSLDSLPTGLVVVSGDHPSSPVVVQSQVSATPPQYSSNISEGNGGNNNLSSVAKNEDALSTMTNGETISNPWVAPTDQLPIGTGIQPTSTNAQGPVNGNVQVQGASSTNTQVQELKDAPVTKSAEPHLPQVDGQYSSLAHPSQQVGVPSQASLTNGSLQVNANGHPSADRASQGNDSNHTTFPAPSQVPSSAMFDVENIGIQVGSSASNQFPHFGPPYIAGGPYEPNNAGLTAPNLAGIAEQMEAEVVFQPGVSLAMPKFYPVPFIGQPPRAPLHTSYIAIRGKALFPAPPGPVGGSGYFFPQFGPPIRPSSYAVARLHPVKVQSIPAVTSHVPGLGPKSSRFALESQLPQESGLAAGLQVEGPNTLAPLTYWPGQFPFPTEDFSATMLYDHILTKDLPLEKLTNISNGPLCVLGERKLHKYPVVCITGLPLHVTRQALHQKILQFTETVSLIYTSPIHIVWDCTGKPVGFVELKSIAASFNLCQAIEGSHESGKPVHMGNQPIRAFPCNQTLLMEALFQYAKVDWAEGRPVRKSPLDTNYAQYDGMLTQGYLNDHVCANGQNLRGMTLNTPRRYEELVSILIKYPWQEVSLVSPAERDQLFSFTCRRLAELKQLLTTMQGNLDVYSIFHELLYTALNATGFTELQRCGIADITRARELPTPVLSRIARDWPFRALGRRPEVPESYLETFAHIVGRALGDTLNPFGRIYADISDCQTMEEAAAREWLAISIALRSAPLEDWIRRALLTGYCC